MFKSNQSDCLALLFMAKRWMIGTQHKRNWCADLFRIRIYCWTYMKMGFRGLHKMYAIDCTEQKAYGVWYMLGSQHTAELMKNALPNLCTSNAQSGKSAKLNDCISFYVSVSGGLLYCERTVVLANSDAIVWSKAKWSLCAFGFCVAERRVQTR